MKYAVVTHHNIYCERFLKIDNDIVTHIGNWKNGQIFWHPITIESTTLPEWLKTHVLIKAYNSMEEVIADYFGIML